MSKLDPQQPKIKLRTPIEDLESKTSSEIYTELKDNQWAETK